MSSDISFPGIPSGITPWVQPEARKKVFIGFRQSIVEDIEFVTIVVVSRVDLILQQTQIRAHMFVIGKYGVDCQYLLEGIYVEGEPIPLDKRLPDGPEVMKTGVIGKRKFRYKSMNVGTD